MRKLMFLITLIAVTFMATAQMSTANIRPGQTYAEDGTDVTLTNAVAQYWLVNAPQNYYTAQTITVALDSLAGDHTSVTVGVSGRVSDQAAWTDIGSDIVWSGTTEDTVIVWSNTAENAYRQYKILFTGAGTGTTTIANREFKQWFGLP
jgi:hypothetical protein